MAYQNTDLFSWAKFGSRLTYPSELATSLHNNNRGTLRGREYVPKKGDLIFLDLGGASKNSANSNTSVIDQVGIVTSANSSTVFAIEGNTTLPGSESNASLYVATKNYALNSSPVWGYLEIDRGASSTLPTGVTLSSSSVSLTVGRTQQLKATVSPTNAANKNVTWSSSNSSVASVSTSGVVTAKAVGSATITVKTSAGAKTATCLVKVTGVIPTSVALSSTTLSLTIGKTQQLSATVSPTNATDKKVTWSSSNTTVAYVSSSGLVTARAAGSAIITAKTQSGAKTATCAITVSAIPTTGVALSLSSVSLTVGKSQQLGVTISPSNATDKKVIWSSSNAAVATVSASGLVTAKGAGSAIITVKTNSGAKTAKSTVIVK